MDCKQPEINPKNSLNELTNTRWMVETKSVWFSRPPQRDKLKAQHPATFAESDIVRLIEFFTKPGERVLDPFLGSGSTLVACAADRPGGDRDRAGRATGRRSRGSASRRNQAMYRQEVILGDSRNVTPRLDDEIVSISSSPARHTG